MKSLILKSENFCIVDIDDSKCSHEHISTCSINSHIIIRARIEPGEGGGGTPLKSGLGCPVVLSNPEHLLGSTDFVL